MKRSRIMLAAATLGLCAFLTGSAGGQPAGGGKRSLGPRTIAPPAPVWIIASYDSAGRANMMTASWAGVCCSRPPCVAVSLREATYTYHCIMASEAFTVNIPSVDLAAAAAYAGTVSGRDTDKFAATGLTAVRSSLVNAPYLGECPLVLECRLVRTVELGLHTMFIGEIVDVKADELILGENGSPDPARHRAFVFSVGGYGFNEVGRTIGTVPELAGRYLGAD
ncbi:MAG: flavin reductase family protein [Candidatus Krumholzibacteria bacterium]|nr:flavin reductase family protein [Candidatus Krumholzibacteria bacterium]